MNRVDCAWAAGLFDGEGSINSQIRVQHSDGVLRYIRFINLSIGQKYPEVLDRFHGVVKLGKVYRYPDRSSNRFSYRVTGPKAILVFNSIESQLTIRKRVQGTEAISYYTQFEGFHQLEYTKLFGPAENYYSDKAGEVPEKE